MGAQPHAGAEVGDLLLLRQDVDHRIRGRRVELAGVCCLQPADVAGEFDHGALQPQADPQERDLLFPGEPDGLDLALDPSDTEPARYQDAVET